MSANPEDTDASKPGPKDPSGHRTREVQGLRDLCRLLSGGELAVGDSMNSHGYPVVRLTEGKACRGCGRCFVMCPDLVFTLVPETIGHEADDERQ